MLLGVRAVIAQSFERIHRSNLIGMGVLPLQFAAGESAGSLGLSGGALHDRGPRRRDGRRRSPAGGGAGERPARVGRGGPLQGTGAHRHAPGGRLLPARRFLQFVLRALLSNRAAARPAG